MALVPEYISDARTRLNANIFAIRDYINGLLPGPLPFVDGFALYLDVVLSSMAATEDEAACVVFREIISKWEVRLDVDMDSELVFIKICRPKRPHADARFYPTHRDPEAHDLLGKLLKIDWIEKSVAAHLKGA